MEKKVSVSSSLEIKDSILKDSILKDIKDNIQHQHQQYQDYQQEEDTTQDISSRLNYLL